jgi:putative oxidoreductase
MIIKSIIKTTNIPTLLIRLTAGSIFLSEGLQKFITPAATGAGRFAKLGFSNPSFWAYFTGSFEMVCGVLLLIGLLTRIAAIPLLIIMVVAFITTKIPILIDQGLWSFAHGYRTDFAMTMLLIYLIIYGGGNGSIDQKINHSKTISSEIGCGILNVPESMVQ